MNVHGGQDPYRRVARLVAPASQYRPQDTALYEPASADVDREAPTAQDATFQRGEEEQIDGDADQQDQHDRGDHELHLVEIAADGQQLTEPESQQRGVRDQTRQP